jgi:hypothetical protein
MDQITEIYMEGKERPCRSEIEGINTYVCTVKVPESSCIEDGY